MAATPDFSVFFTQLSVGILGLTPLVPWRAVGKGFYLTNLLVGLCLLPFAWFFRASSGLADNPGIDLWLFLAYGILALAAVAVFWVGKGASGALLTTLAALTGWAAVAADGVRVAATASSPAASPVFLALDFICGAGLLGTVLGAMLLGHWYLVVKDLPVAPLRNLTLLLFAFLALRILLVAVAWMLDPTGLAAAAGGLPIIVIVRVLFGLGCPLAMSWMIWGTVSIRSTQAATGILYGVSVFVLMGEAASRFLLLKTGFPL
jgi:hypothetical protein